MTDQENIQWFLQLSPSDRYTIRYGGMKVMQGPERHLVGQSRSAGRPGDVEEAKPGRRGVGEIGGAAELLRHIERKDVEARLRRNDAEEQGLPNFVKTHINGELTALRELREWLSDTAEKRSDLSNSEL